MSLDLLSSELYGRDNTQNVLSYIENEILFRQFNNIEPTIEAITPTCNIDNTKLLLWASIFAESSCKEHKESAILIIHYLMLVQEETSIKSAAMIVLSRLGLEPAIDMSIKKQYIENDYESSLPFSYKSELYVNNILRFFVIKNGKCVHLNPFQSEFIDSISKKKYISVSAPTSAGKSYIISRWIELLIMRSDKALRVAYIVPTRALIQQVQLDLQELFSGMQNQLKITSSPVVQINPDQSVIYVLTQERLHMLQNLRDEEVYLDLVVIDEAHKISDGNWGILLEQVISIVIKSCADSKGFNTKIVFLSPLTENPEVLLTGLDLMESIAIKSTFVTVNQKLLWLRQHPDYPKKWSFYKISGDNESFIGNLNLSVRPGNSKVKKLACVAYDLAGFTDGNLVYVNGAADAEKTAGYIADFLTEDISLNPEIKELCDLVKNTIHKDYVLRMTLKKGVGFHYGNMPLLIRNEIERLFKRGVIKFLVCTSTLIEGVNLPAKNIFLNQPQKGKDTPLNEMDFWNLAGRAGRLGKEFQGNIICLEPEVWSAPKKRNLYKIEKASFRVFNNANHLTRYIINNDLSDVFTEDEGDQALGMLITEFLRDGTLTDLMTRSEINLDNTNELERLVASVLDKNCLPEFILKRNPSISPERMANLYTYFKEKTSQEGVDYLIPILPESDNAYVSYIKLISRIHRELLGKKARRVPYFSMLVIKWMKGHSLARIISSQVKYYKDQEAKGKDVPKLPAIIRDTMRDIDKYVRFEFLKYINCYIDVLKFFLLEEGENQLIEDIPDIGMWLEFGVSKQTELSLISMGFSRTSAILISEKIIFDDFSEDKVVSWILEHNIDQLELSEIVIAEINKIIHNI